MVIVQFIDKSDKSPSLRRKGVIGHHSKLWRRIGKRSKQMNKSLNVTLSRIRILITGIFVMKTVWKVLAMDI